MTGLRTLTDGVVTLRPPTEADAETMAGIVSRCRDHLWPWMVWATPDYATEDALFWIRGEADPTAHNFIVVDETNAPVGSAGLNRFVTQDSHADLGYWIAPEACGRGLATRATNLLLRYGIEDAGLNRVEIWMSTQNEPSRAVAERSWATYEGTLRQYLVLDGQAHDAHCYSLLAEELPQLD